MLQVVKVATRPSGLGGEVLGAGAGPVEEQPSNSIEHSGLSRPVVPINAGAVASQVESCITNALEVFDMKGIDPHLTHSFG